jgi:hypothetical protein
MVYPYVATTVTTLVSFGLLIVGALWLAIRFNW